MQICSRLIWLLLACALAGIRARNIHWNFNDRLDEDSARNDQRRQWYFQRLMSNNVANYQPIDQINPHEQDRILVSTRRAKAIIKGDPREFMG